MRHCILNRMDLFSHCSESFIILNNANRSALRRCLDQLILTCDKCGDDTSTILRGVKEREIELLRTNNTSMQFVTTQRRIQDFWKGGGGGSNNYIHKRGWVLEGACPSRNS